MSALHVCLISLICKERVREGEKQARTAFGGKDPLQAGREGGRLKEASFISLQHGEFTPLSRSALRHLCYALL